MRATSKRRGARSSLFSFIPSPRRATPWRPMETQGTLLWRFPAVWLLLASATCGVLLVFSGLLRGNTAAMALVSVIAVCAYLFRSSVNDNT